jgi:hypothetical protein
MYPGLGYSVAIMTNYDDAMARVDGRLRLELAGQRVPDLVTLGAGALQQFAGRYQPVLPPGAHVMGPPPPISVVAGGGDLEVNPGVGPAINFEPMSRDEFFDKDDPEVRIAFARDAAGRVTALNTKTGFGPVPPITARRLPR